MTLDQSIENWGGVEGWTEWEDILHRVWAKAQNCDSTMHYGHDHGVGRWEELLTRDRAEEISQKWPQQDFFTLGLEGKGRSVAWPLPHSVYGLGNKVGAITKTGKAGGET